MPRVHESVARAEIAEAFAVVSRRAAAGASSPGVETEWVTEVVGMCGGWEALKKGLRAEPNEARCYRDAWWLFAQMALGITPPCDAEGQGKAGMISEIAWSRIQAEAEKWLTQRSP